MYSLVSAKTSFPSPEFMKVVAFLHYNSLTMEYSIKILTQKIFPFIEHYIKRYSDFIVFTRPFYHTNCDIMNS